MRNLKRLLKRKEVQSIIQLLSEDPYSIIDSEGKVLIGENNQNRTAFDYPIKLQNRVIGFFRGGKQASAIASLLSYLACQEDEKRALGAETLEKYKEITVLYDITEKLSANLNPVQVARLVIDEVKRLIKADNIYLMIMNEEEHVWEELASLGEALDPKLTYKFYGILDTIFAAGKADIINDLTKAPKFVKEGLDISSLMYTPLKMKGQVKGILFLSSAKPANYKAADLKILAVLALQAAYFIENAWLYESLKDTFHKTVYTLAETIEKRDPYTGGHARRVMKYSIALGNELGLSELELENLRLAAILHDIGKIGIRDNVLLKNGRLNDLEFCEIKKHTIYGQEVLNHIRDFKDIIPGVVSHHERFDGSGYPNGLQGEGIAFIARIIAVADTYDAMTTDRSYRKSSSREVAIEEIMNNAGTQFDPQIVKAFLSLDMEQKY